MFDQQRFIDEVTDLAMIVYRLNRSLSRGAEMDDMPPLPCSHFHALLIIGKKQLLNMTALAEYLQVTRQQLTRIVDALVKKELVERRIDSDNRRQVILRLSPQGEQCLHDALISRPSALSALIDTIDDNDAERFMGAISTIREVLSKL